MVTGGIGVNNNVSILSLLSFFLLVGLHIDNSFARACVCVSVLSLYDAELFISVCEML